MSLRAIPEAVAAATREEIPILSLRKFLRKFLSAEFESPTGPIMKTFLAHLAVKPSDTGPLSSLKRWLLMRQDLLRYGMAPLAVAIAFVARMALTPIVQGDSPYLFFIPAVLVAAGLGGLGPGLLATGLSAVLDLFVITDFRTLRFPKSSTPLHSS
jgi:K+-sensing histidine kinase KdpD